MGWHVAAFVALPLVAVLVYGWYLGELRRDNFWLPLITGFVVGLCIVAVFPFIFFYF
jgi:hypothetical protein